MDSHQGSFSKISKSQEICSNLRSKPSLARILLCETFKLSSTEPDDDADFLNFFEFMKR